MSKKSRLQLALLPGVLLVVLTVAVYAGCWPVALDIRVAWALPGRHVTGLAGFLLSLSTLVADVATPAVTVSLTAAAATLLTKGYLSLAQVAGRLVPTGPANLRLTRPYL